MRIHQRPDLMKKWTPQKDEASRYNKTFGNFSWNPDSDEKEMSEAYKEAYISEILQSPILSKMFPEKWLREQMEYSFLILTGENHLPVECDNQITESTFEFTNYLSRGKASIFSNVCIICFGNSTNDCVTNTANHELSHLLMRRLKFLQDGAAVFIDTTLSKENHREHEGVVDEYANQLAEINALRQIVGDETVGKLLGGDTETFKKAFSEKQSLVDFDEYVDYSNTFFGEKYNDSMARILSSVAKNPSVEKNSQLGTAIDRFFENTIRTVNRIKEQNLEELTSPTQKEYPQFNMPDCLRDNNR